MDVSSTGRRPFGRSLALSIWLAAAPAAAADPNDLEAMKAQLEALAEHNRELSRSVEQLREQVEAARDDARAARDAAAAAPGVPPAPAGAGYGAPSGGLAETSFGGTRLQLIDLSLLANGAFGFSSAVDEELALLQAGDHDPRRRGFNLQNVELALAGAVDPYFDARANIALLITPEGETKIELEEAYALSRQLPFFLHEQGLQLKAGQYFTEFGRLNAKHPHQWDWQDQPLVLTRFFGADGLRGAGARLGWLSPLPWYSEILVGAQNAQGETLVSFGASDEVFEERPIGGRPFASTGTRGAGDLVYLARWVNGGDLSDTWSAQLGLSYLYGPNATGSDGRTQLFGIDAVLKWRPLVSDRGWPFVKLEGELLRRHYHSDSFSGCAGEADEGADCEPLSLSSQTLRDWGGYLQLLWGFRRPWAAGIRYEYASGSGESVGLYDGRSSDPFRDDRQRIAPLVVFHPSEFSRIRLQYNYDRADFSEQGANHTLWLGLEFGIGPHGAHSY